jgi:hypothetical protein
MNHLAITATIPSVFFATVGILISYGLYVYHDKKRKQKAFEDKNEKDISEYLSGFEIPVQIKLLPMEETNYMYALSISTATFYEGDIPTGPILHRLKEILIANPWLASRLLQKKEDKTPKFYYGSVFDESTLPQYFDEFVVDNTIADVKLTEKSLDSIIHYASKHLVQRGWNCLNDLNEVCFRVLIIKIKEESSITRTVFILSFSHVLGDGYTYYTIYSFFNLRKSSSFITRLNPHRQPQFPQMIANIQGRPFQVFFASFLFFCMCVKNIVFARRPSTQIFQVNLEKINQLKQTFNNKHTFVSTNDLLSSWFFQRLQCDYGLIVMNCRQRLKEFSHEMVGNYIAVLPFKKFDPLTIRETIQTFGQSNAPETPLLTLLGRLKFSIAMITNWSSFYSEIYLDKDQSDGIRYPLLYHCPLVTTEANGFPDHIIIFAPKKNELGVYVMSRTLNNPEAWVTNDSLLTVEPPQV